MEEKREASIVSTRKILSSKKRRKTRGKSWNFRREAAIPCKVKNHQWRETCGESDTRGSKYACIVEAHESTRKRLERTLPKNHEDRIAGKGVNSLSHQTFVHKFIPMPLAMKMPRMRKRRWTKNGKNDQSKEWKRGHPRGTERAKNSPFCHADGHLSSQGCGILWRRQFEKSSMGTGMGKSAKLGMPGLCIEIKVYSYMYTWMTQKWLEESKTSDFCGRNWWNWLTWENRHHFLTTCTWDALDVNANRTIVSLMKTKKVRVTNLCWNDWAITWVGNIAREYDRLVLRHGRSCSKVRGKMLRTVQQKDGVVVQSLNTMFGRPQLQEGRTGNGWRIVKRLLTNCLEMFNFGTNW